MQAFQAAWMMTKHDGISLHEFALKLPVCLFQVWSGARDGGDRNMERNPIPLKIHKNTGLNEAFVFVLTSLELCVCASVCAFKVD